MPETNQTISAAPQTDHWIVDALKKQTIGIIVAVLWGFYTFVWNSHDSVKDLKYQVDTNTKQIEQIRLDTKQQAEAQNQFLIAITKISEAQNRLAQDVKDIQVQQQKNSELLFNRK